MIDSNALYYTLSTISQTLAGALAVLVAFVVLRVQQCDAALAEGRITFFTTVRDDPAAWHVVLTRGWRAASDEFDGLGGHPRPQDPQSLQSGVHRAPRAASHSPPTPSLACVGAPPSERPRSPTFGSMTAATLSPAAWQWPGPTSTRFSAQETGRVRLWSSGTRT